MSWRKSSPPPYPRPHWASFVDRLHDLNMTYYWLIDDRLCSAILRSLEQTHCARMWFDLHEWLAFYSAFCWISTEMVYVQRWHGWCHIKLQPSRRKFCVHHTTMLHVTSCKATAVACHLRFWQNDPNLLRATAVTRRWNGYRNKSQHRKSTLEKKILPPLLRGWSTSRQWLSLRL